MKAAKKNDRVDPGSWTPSKVVNWTNPKGSKFYFLEVCEGGWRGEGGKVNGAD